MALSIPNTIPRTLVVICAGVVFLLLSLWFDWFVNVDRAIYDLGLRARPQLDYRPDVVIVAIDQRSRAMCFPPPEFPISSHVAEHGTVIDNLVAAKAKVIGLDVLFDQLDPSLDLGALISAISKAEVVVLASAIERREVATKDEAIVIEEERLVLPSESIPSALYSHGLVNVPIDSDHVVRRASRGRRFQGMWLPSLPAALAGAFKGSQSSLVSGGEFYVDYSSPASGFEVIPYADVLTQTGWEDLVSGRIALIGVTENSFTDVCTVPLSGLKGAVQKARLPGVFVLAYATETLLRGRIVSPASLEISLALGVLLIAGIAILTVGRRLGLSLGLGLIIAISTIILGVIVNALSVTVLPSGKLFAAVTVTGAVGLAGNYWYTRLVSEARGKELAEISSDLHSAQRIQQRLQPETMPEIADIDIAGLQIPCKEVGGDYYDVISLHGDKLGLLIADVSGKGVSGALLMSNLQSAFRTAALDHPRPSEIVARLNEIVVRVAVEGRFITLFYGILDVRARVLVYSNAGHNPPFVLRGNDKVERLSQAGLPLGVVSDFKWMDSEVHLRKGDVLLLYTDGVTEAFREKSDQQFGEDRLIECMTANRFQPATVFAGDLVSRLRTFAHTDHFTDDVTILTVKIA